VPAPAGRKRADQLAFEQGLAESREKAKRLVMAGLVRIETDDGPRPVDKPGQQLPPDAVLSLTATERYVSRGGEKLETALDHFAIDPAGLVCLDAGASTGGFTDCLLQRGAARVYAVDVGTNQLHEKLRTDPRVVSMEKTTLRDAPADLIPEPVDLIVADVSFISLTLILPACLRFAAPACGLVALVKPQFELEPRDVPKGVVRDPALRQKAVDKVVNFCQNELRLDHRGTVPARIKGPKGNQEFLAWFTRTNKETT
jgi:23S rRNA (cytidine1920-2'-O)/16S rRNA (cytidine1409-2'-O)-methyltransferase